MHDELIARARSLCAIECSAEIEPLRFIETMEALCDALEAEQEQSRKLILCGQDLGTEIAHLNGERLTNQLELRLLREQLEAAQNTQRWIPVAERLPEHCGMPLLLVGVNGYGQHRVFEGFTGYYDRGTLLFHSNVKDIDIDQWDITHWMPLPTAAERS